MIELIPRADQYPADWDSWPVNHELDAAFKLPQVRTTRLVQHRGIISISEKHLNISVLKTIVFPPLIILRLFPDTNFENFYLIVVRVV